MIQVLGLDEIDPAKLLLALDERSVGGQGLTVPYPYGGCRSRGLQPNASDIRPAFVSSSSNRSVVIEGLLHRVRPHRREVDSPIIERLVFHEVDRNRWSDLERLFESPGGPKHCWCMVWRSMPREARSDRQAKKAALEARVYRFMGFVPAFEAAGFRRIGTAGIRCHVMRLSL